MADNAVTLIDAQQKAVAYRGLAQHYVQNGDAWSALHAQIISDVAEANLIVGRTGDGNSFLPGPSLGNLAENTTIGEEATPEEVLAAIREALTVDLPEGLQEEWEDGIGTADIFSTLTVLSPDALLALVATRFQGESVEQYVQKRYSEAASLMADARKLHAEGSEWDAVLAAYASDIAAFQGWLFQHSLESGDYSFIQAEMRWALAVVALAEVGELPTDIGLASDLVRSRLAWAVGPIDAEAFARRVTTI